MLLVLPSTIVARILPLRSLLVLFFFPGFVCYLSTRRRRLWFIVPSNVGLKYTQFHFFFPLQVTRVHLLSLLNLTTRIHIEGNRRDLPEIEDVEPVSSDHVRGRVHRWGKSTLLN